jgi:hypothetical protein
MLVQDEAERAKGRDVTWEERVVIRVCFSVRATVFLMVSADPRAVGRRALLSAPSQARKASSWEVRSFRVLPLPPGMHGLHRCQTVEALAGIS